MRSDDKGLFIFGEVPEAGEWIETKEGVIIALLPFVLMNVLVLDFSSKQRCGQLSVMNNCPINHRFG
jgi:hypothetical protein